MSLFNHDLFWETRSKKQKYFTPTRHKYFSDPKRGRASRPMGCRDKMGNRSLQEENFHADKLLFKNMLFKLWWLNFQKHVIQIVS